MPSSWWKSAAIIIGGACAFLMPSALSGAHGIPRETGLISPLVICLIIQACATAGAYPTRWIETSNHHVLHALGAATLVFVLVTLLRRMIHSPSERTVKRGLTLVLISNVLAFAVIVDLLNNTGSRSCPGGTMERPSSAAYDDTWL